MSAIPGAIDALVDMFGRQLGRGVQVIDGPPVVDVRGDLVAVGLAPQEPADVESAEETAGLAVVRESFTVICMARSWSGDAAVKAQRDRTFRLVTGVKTALREDRTLGGLVQQARFAGLTYTPWRDNNLLVVEATFRVAIVVLADA